MNDRQAIYHTGFDPDGVAEAEADHFGNCPGPYLDVRDLAQMLAHVHDAEIEIRKGLEPPLASGFPLHNG